MFFSWDAYDCAESTEEFIKDFENLLDTETTRKKALKQLCQIARNKTNEKNKVCDDITIIFYDLGQMLWQLN